MNLIPLLKKWKRLIVPTPIRFWWLERQINSEFAEKIKEAKAKKETQEVRRLQDKHSWNLAEIRDSRNARIQRKWIRKAGKLMIPLPPQDIERMLNDDDDNWEISRPANEALLKPQAMINLRREVRREQKESRDGYIRWITVVVGLVGALTGLVSVLLRSL